VAARSTNEPSNDRLLNTIKAVLAEYKSSIESEGQASKKKNPDANKDDEAMREMETAITEDTIQDLNKWIEELQNGTRPMIQDDELNWRLTVINVEIIDEQIRLASRKTSAAERAGLRDSMLNLKAWKIKYEALRNTR
jgi:hypothetical protein